MSVGTSSQWKTVKLPSIDIPKLSGKLTKWLTYLGLFEAAIGIYSDHDEVQTFQYLRSYLQGPAIQAIHGLTSANSNYTTALKILKDVFGNVQQIVSSHMEKLPNLLNISSDTNLAEIRKIFDEIQLHH